jgi:hypothetical protein
VKPGTVAPDETRAGPCSSMACGRSVEQDVNRLLELNSAAVAGGDFSLEDALSPSLGLGTESVPGVVA